MRSGVRRWLADRRWRRASPPRRGRRSRRCRSRPPTEVRLPAARGHPALAEALRADSIPATRLEPARRLARDRLVRLRDRPATKHRPIGLEASCACAAWADPTRPGSSKLFVETVYRPVADPSLPERELDRQVPRDHPVAIKVRAALQDLVKRYGGPPPPPAATGQPHRGGE